MYYIDFQLLLFQLLLCGGVEGKSSVLCSAGEYDLNVASGGDKVGSTFRNYGLHMTRVVVCTVCMYVRAYV